MKIREIVRALILMEMVYSSVTVLYVTSTPKCQAQNPGATLLVHSTSMMIFVLRNVSMIYVRSA